MPELLQDLLYLQAAAPPELGYLLLSPERKELRYLNTFRLDDKNASRLAASRDLLDEYYDVISPEGPRESAIIQNIVVGGVYIMCAGQVDPWAIIDVLVSRKGDT